MTLTTHIEAAIAGLRAYNDIQAAWRTNALAGGYAAHFKAAPTIPDHLLIELLEAITEFDCDPQGTLDELRFQNEPTERDYCRYNAPTDAEWDYAVAKGFAP